MFNEITKPYYLLALTKTNKYSNIETFTNTSTSNTNSNNNEEEASYFELQCLHNMYVFILHHLQLSINIPSYYYLYLL